MAPSSRQEARLRKAVLSLAKETEFGKRMINGGRLSVPSIYDSAPVDRRLRSLARWPGARCHPCLTAPLAARRPVKPPI